MLTDIKELLGARGLWSEGYEIPEAVGCGRGPRFDFLCRLAASGRVDRGEVASVLATAAMAEPIGCDALQTTETVLAHIEGGRALQHGWLPLFEEAGALVLAVADPLDHEALLDLGDGLRLFIEPRVADALDLFDRILSAYGLAGPEEGAAENAILGLKATGGAPFVLDPPGAEADPLDGPVEAYVHELIAQAVRQRASDIHLEPLVRKFRIRIRVDGRLREIAVPSKHLQPAILSRLKLMAGLSITERRLPQDGRLRAEVDGHNLDLRVSTMPGSHGETIVMRILDRGGLQLGLEELGLSAKNGASFRRLLNQPDGLLLVTGPTGSGKSTTLYAALHELNQPDRKIITVEDPVEYQLAGVNQVQVRPDVGMTFAAALRALLRQAPNIIMVGEIRDRETADIAVNASLTGHMVFSTLHTNDAPSAVSRLVDIGVPAFLAGAALRGILAQRLVRAVCGECADVYDPGEVFLREAGLDPDELGERIFRRGRGCSRCGGRGFYGRKGLFELLEIDDGMRRLIYDRASLTDLRIHARSRGMRTLREDGFAKAAAGLTTLDEVLAVTVGHPDLHTLTTLQTCYLERELL